MRKCAVLGCPNSKFYCRDKTFFKFPLKNEKLLQVWLKNIGRRSFKPSTSSIVCSDHFSESSYDVCPFTKRKKLKQGSFPINFNQPPKPRPHCVLLSTATNGNYPQLGKSKQFIPGSEPSVSPNLLASTSSQPLISSENPQDKGKIRIPRLQKQEQQCVQISIIPPPNEQLQSQNPNCVPILLNKSMIILPLNVNQAPKAHSTYENRRGRKKRLLKQTAVPSTSRRLAPKPDINTEKRESQASSETESQNVAETSVAINQEPVKSADKPPLLIIKKTASSSSINLLPSTSSSSISLPRNSSSSYGSAPFPEKPLPLAHPNSINVAEISIDIKQEPAETAAAPLPNFALSSPTNIVEMSIDIKQEPVESAAAPLPDSVLPGMLTFPCPSSSRVAEMSIDINEEPIESATAPLPDMLRSPNSTNVAEASMLIKHEPIESAAAPLSDCILPDFAYSSSTPSDTSTAIKREPDGSVDESPLLVSKEVHLAEETASSTSILSPTISSSYSISSSTSSSSPSISSSYSISVTSSSSSSCSSAAPSPQNALPFAPPHSTNADETPAVHIPNKPTKKRIIFLKAAEPDAAQAKRPLRTKSSVPSKPAVASKKSVEGISRTSQADLCWRTLMSMASKKNHDLHSPKKPGGHSSELTNKNGENVSREMLQSLLDVSESSRSFGSRSAERTGDLFDVFADFVAEKLRRMDLDDCAHALRAIVDIVSEPGEVQQDSEG